MKKLKKGFEASKETLIVNIDGNDYKIANLLKSGIINQTVVLLSANNQWNEIDVLNLGGDNSDLLAFKLFVESHNLKLSDLGIEVPKTVIDYELKHADFEGLQKEFPAYDYIKISVLDSYMRQSKQTTGMYAIREILKMLTRDNKTIAQYIDEHKNVVLKNSQTVETKYTVEPGVVVDSLRTKNREIELSNFDIKWNGEKYEGIGFSITPNSVDNDSDEAWELLIQTIKAAAAAGTYPLNVAEDNQTSIPEVIQIDFETENYPGEKQLNEETLPKIMETVVLDPSTEQESVFFNPTIPSAQPEPQTAKKPVSIITIGNLTPDRIAELQGLEEKQLKIVEDNPFVKITDKATLKLAKERKAILLRASTETEKIETDATKYLNTFKKMLKDAILPKAKITRDAHELQSNEITTYENAEAIRIQAENAAKLKKIQDRTDELFAIPMVFNGTIYTIGTLYVLPSQIETATDEEFTIIVEQGKAIKFAIDSAEKSKDDEINELKRKIALLENMSNTDEVVQEEPHEFITAESVAEISEPLTIMMPTAMGSTEKTAKLVTLPSTPVSRFKPSMEYVLPQQNNAVLNKFDLDHVDVIGKNPMPEAFVKCRAYFIEGAKQTANEIELILNDTDVTVKKSVRITELCAILKSQL